MIFYFRGICYERSKQWPKAEADLKKALELFPEQPHVLNYLGYSWVDQGINLDDGMAMIKRAVQQRPDDGYIVDSLGWAYFRIGNYEEAAKQLERAIELKPEDPTINDHLGDAYWRVGRVLEAKFQWAHARDLKPDPEDLPKIEEKLKNGLPDETSSQAKARQEGRRRRLGSAGLSRRSLLVEQAPAKINLTLRVLGRRADGYHELESLVAFADLADTLTLQPGAKTALDISGPFAAASGTGLRQSGAQGGRRAAPTHCRPDGGTLPARKEYSGGRRHRRRLGRCGGGLAAHRPRQRSCARRSAADRGGASGRRRCAGLPRRARASCAASAIGSRRRSICRRCRRCWSIRAWRWRRATCSPNLSGAARHARTLDSMPRAHDAH